MTKVLGARLFAGDVGGAVWLLRLACGHMAARPRVRNVYDGPRPAPRRVACGECRRPLEVRA